MFHIKCVLFRQCNQYGINSISVIDASLIYRFFIHSLFIFQCKGYVVSAARVLTTPLTAPVRHHPTANALHLSELYLRMEREFTSGPMAVCLVLKGAQPCR